MTLVTIAITQFIGNKLSASFVNIIAHYILEPYALEIKTENSWGDLQTTSADEVQPVLNFRKPILAVLYLRWRRFSSFVSPLTKF